MLMLREIACSFDDVVVLCGIDLQVAHGEIVCLLGPSGCGKTTLLRIIAGLEQADEGDVLIEGHSISRVPVHQRGFGLMFQDFALFPHLNVEKNVMFGLRMRGDSASEQRERAREVLELVGLAGFADRDVSQLSGGEKQRVALARSLAPNPRLLMLDEPLGSLDASLRERLAVDLRSIIKRIGLTAIHVTHDQQEAFAIADRVAVMNAGRIEQVDTPEALYRKPATIFTAKFLGLNNILPAENDANDAVREVLGEQLPQPLTGASVLLHPDGIRIAAATSGDEGYIISGRVIERLFRGNMYLLRIRHETGFMLTFTHVLHEGPVPEVGQDIRLRVSPDAIIPLR